MDLPRVDRFPVHHPVSNPDNRHPVPIRRVSGNPATHGIHGNARYRFHSFLSGKTNRIS
jgi:hypothetical protein